VSEIRKIVWKGPFEETDNGRHLRGIVGRQRDNMFRAGHQVLYSDFGISYHYRDYWSPKPYPHKELAIFHARERVADIVEAEREPERDDPRVSRFTQRYVDRTFASFQGEASRVCEGDYERYAQHFTDNTNRLIARAKRPDLKDYLQCRANRHPDYLRASRLRDHAQEVAGAKADADAFARVQAELKAMREPGEPAAPAQTRDRGPVR
jgi:hypothetical protein